MYQYFRGVVTALLDGMCVVECGGVGYCLLVSAATLERLHTGQEATVYVHLSVSEDAMTLYGFHSLEERAMFRRLLSVTRVGPKAALSVLSTMSPADAAMCIVSEDDVALARVPGLGKKTAQRIILELKEKIAAEEALGGKAPGSAGAMEGAQAEAMSALVALGYDANTAANAVRSAEGATVEALLRGALMQLGRK